VKTTNSVLLNPCSVPFHRNLARLSTRNHGPSQSFRRQRESFLLINPNRALERQPTHSRVLMDTGKKSAASRVESSPKSVPQIPRLRIHSRTALVRVLTEKTRRPAPMRLTYLDLSFLALKKGRGNPHRRSTIVGKHCVGRQPPRTYRGLARICRTLMSKNLSDG
jgi:hypothetical protein